MIVARSRLDMDLLLGVKGFWRRDSLTKGASGLDMNRYEGQRRLAVAVPTPEERAGLRASEVDDGLASLCPPLRGDGDCV